MDEEVTEIAAEEFASVFRQMKGYWPEKIDVSEQYPFANGGMRIPALSDAHDSIEERIEDEMEGLRFHVAHTIEFAIFTLLHTMIREKALRRVGRAQVDEEKVRSIVNSYEAWSLG